MDVAYMHPGQFWEALSTSVHSVIYVPECEPAVTPIALWAWPCPRISKNFMSAPLQAVLDEVCSESPLELVTSMATPRHFNTLSCDLPSSPSPISSHSSHSSVHDTSFTDDPVSAEDHDTSLSSILGDGPSAYRGPFVSERPKRNLEQLADSTIRDLGPKKMKHDTAEMLRSWSRVTIMQEKHELFSFTDQDMSPQQSSPERDIQQAAWILMILQN